MNLLRVAGLLLLAAIAAVQGTVEYTDIDASQDFSDSVKLDKFEEFTEGHEIHARQTAESNSTKPTTSTPGNTTTVDDHVYYTSSFYPPGPEADALWFDLAERNDSEVAVANISENFRFYSVHDLPFDFQFYGHTLNQVGISTGGFLYVGPWFHSRIHLTQFVAPLQGDFNPGINDTAVIYIYEDDERYTVQWDEVHNHDHVEAGPFTFQVSLFRNGTIHFVYRNIPLAVQEINNDDHPVFVGLADSFYFDVPIPGGFISRSIFEYHRISLNATLDLSNSAYVITPVPNCISVDSCDACGVRSQSSRFDCEWCEKLNRCSDGFDRHRQEWFTSDCYLESTNNCTLPTTMAPPPPSTTATPETTTQQPTTTPTNPPSTTQPTTQQPTTMTTTQQPTSSPSEQTTSSSSAGTSTTVPSSSVSTTTTEGPGVVVEPQRGSSLGTGPTVGIVIVVVILLIIVILAAIAVVVFWYGYRNPTSSVGLFMIEHRPKARSLNKTSSAAYNVQSGKTALSDEYA